MSNRADSDQQGAVVGAASSRTVAILIGVWLAAALAVGASGCLSGLQPPLPQALLLAISAALVLALRLLAPLRRWARVVPVRAVVALHLSRFVGIYLLRLYDRGELPFAFAVPGGIGDIAVAVLAVLLITLSPTAGTRAWRSYAAWNLVGTVDILLAVVAAARQALSDPPSMAALLRLPLSLLITFLAPLIIASHVLVFIRLRRAHATGYGVL